MIQQAKKFTEEDSHVVSFCLGAAVHGWGDLFEELAEDREQIEVGHLERREQLKEVERKQGVLGRVHQTWVQAVLDEHVDHFGVFLVLTLL